MQIYKDFTFEAAHFLPSAAPGHPNSRIHGHSFHVRVTVEGEPDPETGLVFHFDDLDAAIAVVRSALDHQFLNEIEAIGAPTLENIAIWIWSQLIVQIPALSEVHISRPSCHEGCVYRGK
ncbi:MAG: 6-carboxytetrahydropterin synthase [Hyphomicrobiales bacterium]|nr:6-carboxytetrahydropterin synthase [Hyphomicrobiales bacterium]